MKKLLLIIVLAIILINCQHSNDILIIDENLGNNINSKLRITEGNTLNFIEIPEVLVKLKEITHKSMKKTGNENDLYNFIIDTSRIRKIENNSSKTYVFFIKRNKKGNYFENLVIKYEEEGVPKAYIIKYIPDKEIEYFNHHNSISFSGEKIITPLIFEQISGFEKSMDIDCYEIVTTYCTETGVGDSGRVYSGTHVATSDCHDPNSKYTVVEQKCYIYSSGGGFSVTTSTSPDGNTPGTLNEEIISSPIAEPPCGDPIHGCLLKAFQLASRIGLDAEQRAWFINLNEMVLNQFENFLDANNDSQQALDFSSAAVNALINQGEVDFNNEIIKDKTFIGTKADCVLKALINTDNNLFKTTAEAFTDGNSKFKLKFTTYNQSNDFAIARTGLPDSNGIISIEFNLARINQSSMDLATEILHETIHAELHRIKLTNNAAPNSLPTAQYNWYIKLWDFYENDNMNVTATTAEHYYMANYFINPIASGLRQFDQNTHPQDNYKYFAWTGLQDYGKNAGYITSSELTSLANLSQIVINDSHGNPCD